MEHRRRIATYVMVLGLLVAVAMLGVGRTGFWLAVKRLAPLEAKCSTFSRSSTKPPLPPGYRDPLEGATPLAPIPAARPLPPGVPPPPPGSYIDEPITDKDFVPDCEACDPETLDFCRPELSGIRGEIQQEYRSAKTAWAGVEFWSALIAVLFSIPRGWYFLLGRIAEISGAVRGS